MTSRPNNQRITTRLRKLLLGLAAGATLPLLESCSPEVADTLITGFNDLSVALIDAFFMQIDVQAGAGETTAAIVDMISRMAC